MRAAGGVPVPLADLLAPEFLHSPELLFSEDNYHPSAAGYALAAKQLLPALCNALGEWTGGPVPEQPWVSSAAEARTLRAQLRRLSRRLRRRTVGVPAPVVVPAR